MVTCPKCGEENRKEAIYCRNCGERLQSNIYVKRREPWGIIHIGILIISVLFLITSFGLIMGGTSIRSIQDLMTDEEGFIMSNTKQLQVPSYAIITEEIDFNINPTTWRFFERRGGFLKFKLITESNDPEKELFIGVARREDAFNYINTMEYHEIKEIKLGWEEWYNGTSEITYILHHGDPPSVPPTVHSFWVVQGISAELQTIIWEPQAGNYYLVMMNADGTPNISADVKLGVQLPFFGGIGNILLVSGIFIGAIGIMMLYFTIKRNRP
jgi:hypothetical protein